MKNPKNYNVYVGLDVSKLTIDICLVELETQTKHVTQVENTPDGFNRLRDWLRHHQAGNKDTLLCSEHTGRYSEHLTGWSSKGPWDHAVVKTTALEKVAPEHHRKDDSFDAELLAEYARRFTDKLRVHQDAGPVMRQVRRLQSERRFMVDHRGSLRQKITEAEYHHADMERIVACYRRQIKLLSEQIEWVEQQIKQLISNDDQLHEVYERLLGAPGVGEVLGTLWLTLFAGQQTLDPRQLSSRFGFAPHSHSSGSSVHKKTRSSRYGNGEIRRVMHLAARSVATHTPHYREYYQKKLHEGKPEKLALNNIINKLIRMLCAMWNSNAEYDPTHIQKLKKIHQAA